MEASRECPFCTRMAGSNLLVESDLAAALEDAFPVSPGHALIVPRRHVPDVFELSPDEQAALWALVPAVRAKIAERWAPDGYNVGINIGAAAGQTVWHAHVHVIPRFKGDVDDPRGGIRWVIGAGAAYWNRDR